VNNFIEFNMPYFNIVSYCQYHEKILKIHELKLSFKNTKNKIIESKFDESNIKRFKYGPQYLDMSELQKTPRDYKIFQVRSHVITASVFRNETEFTTNNLIHITKSIPISILTRQYNEFISRYE
jgi:hypothetical protein